MCDNPTARTFGRSLLSAVGFVALAWDMFHALCLAPLLSWLTFSIDWDPFFGMSEWVPISIALIVAALIQVYVLERFPRQQVSIVGLLLALAVVLPLVAIRILNYVSFGPRPIF